MRKLQLALLTFIFCFSIEASKRTEDFISSAVSLLPKKLQNIKVDITFERMNENTLNSPCNSEGFIYGKYNNNVITLSEQFLNHLTPTEEIQFTCKHKNLYKTALSTLIHEYFHAYESTLKKKEKLHQSDEFLALGFWKLNAKNKNLNIYAERSPNRYEYFSPKEFMAVNFEYFILDPEYQCRRPNLYNAFSKKLSHTPFKGVQCNSIYDVSVTDTQQVELVEINFNRVREVHYLYASKGKAAMSRWGHSMYKLVLCDEDWTLQKCRTRGKFVVIGFLAQVEDISVNAIKGIFGKYPSDMTITTLNAMKKQYNRAELRDLESIPLAFDKQEKERFLNHLIRIYWEYSGKYYFFSNNCADEAFKLIQIAKNSKESYSKNILTPVGIYKYIKKNQLSRDFSFTDRDQNISNGLLYSSYAPKLNTSFLRLSSQFENDFKVEIKRPKINRAERHFSPKTKKIKDIHAYSLLSTMKRREIINSVIKVKNRTNILDLYAIESQANFITNNEIFSTIQDLATDKEMNSDIKTLISKIVELKNIITFGTETNNNGYGIPQDGDLDSTISDEVYAAEEELIRMKALLQDRYKDEFKDEFLLMEESNHNKTIIKNALRSVL